jgi:hypothetical protein
MTILSLLLQNYGNPYYDIDFWLDDKNGTVTVGEVWLHKVPQQEAGGGCTYPVTVSMVSTMRRSRSKLSRQPEHVSHGCLERTPHGQAEPSGWPDGGPALVAGSYSTMTCPYIQGCGVQIK